MAKCRLTECPKKLDHVTVHRKNPRQVLTALRTLLTELKWQQ